MVHTIFFTPQRKVRFFMPIERGESGQFHTREGKYSLSSLGRKSADVADTKVKKQANTRHVLFSLSLFILFHN